MRERWPEVCWAASAISAFDPDRYPYQGLVNVVLSFLMVPSVKISGSVSRNMAAVYPLIFHFSTFSHARPVWVGERIGEHGSGRRTRRPAVALET